MKLALIISSILALFAIGILVFFGLSSSPEESSFKLERLVEAAPERQAALLESAFAGGTLPKGREQELLVWIFVNGNEKGIALIRDNAHSLERLPQHLSEAIFQMVRERHPEAVGTALTLGRQLFPNDPDILSMAGIVSYIAQRPLEARRLLEQAVTWQQPNTRADFYLGGILIQADLTADKARGKNLLMRVSASDNPEYNELAALMLLTRTDVPMLDAEKRQLLDRLDALNSFRAGNPNLNPDVVRMLASAAARVDAGRAVKLVRLVMEESGATMLDRIGLIRLLQNQQRFDEAGAELQLIKEGNLVAAGSDEAWEVDRLGVLNALGQGRTEGVLATLAALGEAQPESLLLHETYARALDLGLSIEFQRQMLPLYLKLPLVDASLRLVVLNRLMEIAPLQKREWLQHAAEEVLPKDTLLAAQWLTMNGGAEAVVEAISGLPAPLGREQTMALVEARLDLSQPDLAQQALKQGRTILRPVDAAFFQARIHSMQGRKDLAQESWTEAYNAAMGDNAYDALKRLGFLALDLEQPVIALGALYSAFSSGISFSPQQCAQLIDLTIRYGNIRQSLKIAEHLHTSYPGEPSYTNNYAYLNFLAGEQIDSYVEKMRAIVDEYGDILPFRMTLALGLIKAGRNNEAMRLLQSASINLEDLTVQGKLIYAAVLGANGQQLAARGLIQNLDLAGLTPEEKALVEFF